MCSKCIGKKFIAIIAILAVLLIGGAATVASAITVSGIVKDWSGNLIPAPGVTVTLVGDEAKSTTSSTADGSFSLPDVPANTAFSLKLHREGYLDVYSPNISASADINLNVSATGSTPFNLPTTADLEAFGALPAAGKGLMAGRVADGTYRYSSVVGGAFLTAAGGSKSYPVYYRDSFGNPYRGGTTSGNGIFFVPNVDGSDTVILTASKNGWSFNPVTFGTHADSVSMGRIYGVAPGYVAMSGSVNSTTGAAIAGARLELRGDGGKFTNTAGDGSYTFGGLPRDTHFHVRVTATDKAPTYAAVSNLSGNISGIGIILWTAAEMAGVGVTGGNGLIACRVTDMSLNPISGATVTLQSRSGTVYSPVYLGSGSGSTAATGTVLVPDVLPGDVVKVSAAKAGYDFAPVSLDGFSGAVTARIIAGSTPVAYNSYISDKDMVGIAGVAVEQAGTANATTSSADPAGAFTLNVPYGVPFHLRFSKTGFADTYSAEMTRSAPVNESISDGFTLHAEARLAEWNVASGKGIIRSRVKDGAGNNIAGAAVFYTSSQGRTYTLCYDDACTPGLTATQAGSGRYIVRDVEPGDTVTVTARKIGFSFNVRVFHAYADSVHQGGITGGAVSNSNSVLGTLSYGGSQTGNTRLVLWSADMMRDYSREITISGGSFTFDGVPNGRYFLSAYRDRDGNGQYTAGEAYGYYQNSGGLQTITVSGTGVNIGAVTLADPSAGPTGASVTIDSAIGGLRGYLVFFRSGDFLTYNLQNGINPAFSLDVDLAAGAHGYPVTRMENDFEGMPIPAGTYDFYFMTGDLEKGPDKGVIQYMQTGIAIAKGAVTAVPASGSIPMNAGASISGTVTSSFSAHPLGRVSVFLTGDLPGTILKAWCRTDAAGRFQFDHVPAGTWYLQLVYGGYNAFPPITVTVADGQTLAIPGSSTVLTPAQTPATLSGTLSPFGPGVDSRVLLKLGDTIMASVPTDAATGSYAISDVVPGSYTLVGSARGYTPSQVAVAVTAGQALTRNFTLGGTKSVVVNGLNWLLAHQRADGSFDDNLSGNADPLVFGWTGYAGLTLLAVLENPKYNDSGSPDYLGATLLGQIRDALYGVVGGTPKNGIKQYFESTYHAADDLSTGWNDTGAFYNSTIAWSSVAATPVALEKLIALGMPLSDPRITGAVQFLLGAQVTAARASNPIFAGGWRYNPGNTDSDNWETAWVIMALMKAGVNPTVQAVVDGVNHIRRSQITAGGGAGLFAYQPNDTSGYGPLGTSAACILALNFAGAPNSDPDVDRFFQWVKSNGGFSGYDRWADAYWWSMFPWAAILYDDPASSAPVKKYYDTLELAWNMADDVILRQNLNGSWSNPNYIPGGSNSGNAVMYTASALMAIAPYAGLTPRPDETTISGAVRSPAGAGLPNAKVEALLDGIVRATTVTDGGGAYTLNVPQNYAYTIRVTAAGYARITVATADVGTGGLTGQDIGFQASDEDAAAPAIAGLAPANGSALPGVRPGISAVLTDPGSGGNAPSGIDPAAVSMTLDGNAVYAGYNPATGVVSFAPVNDLAYATHTVTVNARDFAGNAAQASWSFTNTPFTPMVFNVHSSDGYHTYLDVTIGNDYTGALPETIGAIDVTGPGGAVVATRSDFVYYPEFREFLVRLPGQPALGEYRFEVTALSQTTAATDHQSVNRNLPLADKGTFSYTPGGDPTFSWGAVDYTETPLYYRLIINDMAGNRVYSSSRVLGMLSHTVPAGTLQTDQSYQFQVRVDDAAGAGLLQNESRSDFETFPRTAISYTYRVKTAAGAPLEGVAVSVDGNPNPDPSDITDADGMFTLAGLTARSNFYVKMARQGYRSTYSGRVWSQGDIVWDGRSFTLYTPEETEAWPVNFTEKGAISSWVADSSGNAISGASVTAASNLHPAAPYAVTYADAAGNFGGNATYGNGRYVVRDVDEGDIVTVKATKAGMTFNTRTFLAHAGGIGQGKVTGTAAAGTITFTGGVVQANGLPVEAATVQMTGNAGITTQSGTDGSYTLTGLPLNTTFSLHYTKGGYVPLYTRNLNSGGNIASARANILLTQADPDRWGAPSGGLITGRVADGANPATAFIAGATVSYASANGYTVLYLDDTGSIVAGASATTAGGRFAIIPDGAPADGDIVTVTAAKAGWVFPTHTFIVHAGAVSQSGLDGQSGAADEAVIGSRFDGFLGEYNKGAAASIGAVMSFFSTHYRHDGVDFAGRQSQIQQELNQVPFQPKPQPVSVVVTVTNATATVVIDWGGGNLETQYWAKEGDGIWRIVGNGLGTTISYTGYVADSQSPSQIVAGARVEQGGAPLNFATTDAEGRYTLGNLHTGTPFYLKIYGDPSYAPCYSGEMSFTADRVETRDRAFTLFPASRLGSGAGNWNVDAGKGIIRAYVRDRIDGYVGGAVVTAAGRLQATYGVCYDDACTPTLTATREGSGAGRFVIKNVLDGDTVTVTATKAGWTTNSRVYPAGAGAVSQGRITIQGPVSLAVTVNTRGPDWTLLQGALVQVVGFPSVSAVTGTDGRATLAGLPPNRSIPFAVSKEGYVVSYGLFSATGVSTWSIPLYTQQDLNTWGVRDGAGVVYGRVSNSADSNNSTNSLGGAQVTCTSEQGKIYDVVYLNDDYTVAAGATATLANGRYLVLNVVPGDEVTVSARKQGWSFWSRTTLGYAGGVSHGYIHGNAGGAAISIYVKDRNSTPIDGATVRMAENPSLSATTDGSGKATLTDLPLDTPLTFEVMKAGYANAYSRHVTLTGSNSNWGTYYLFPGVNAVWGVPEGGGVVMGWVRNEADGSTLAGARVTCFSERGRKYAVAYLNSDHSIAAGAAATLSGGRFLILDVEPGDTVVATASLAGWTFQPRAYTARANGVNQSNINGRQYRYPGTARLIHGMAPTNYRVYLQVDDPLAAVESISVTGPGIASPLSLAFDSQQKSWSSGEAIGFGAMPSLPLTYTLAVAEQGADTPLKQFLYVAGTTGVPGDVNGDGVVDLADAILSLQAPMGNLPAGAAVYTDADVNGDGRIGMPEAIFILQKVAGVR